MPRTSVAKRNVKSSTSVNGKRKTTTTLARPTKKSRVLRRTPTLALRKPPPKEAGLYQKLLANPMAYGNTAIAYPDAFRGKSVPLCLSATPVHGLGTTTELGAIRFEPSLDAFSASSTVASEFTGIYWTGNQEHPEYQSQSNLKTNIARYRILAIGVSVQYVGPQDSIGGTLSYQFSNVRSSDSTDGSTFADSHSDSGIMGISRKPIVFCMRPFDKPQFILPNANAQNYMNSLSLVTRGVNNTDILIKTKMFIECVPLTTSILHDSAVPSPLGTDVQPAYHSNAVIRTKQD